MRRAIGRRAALLGAAGFLAGCDTVTDVTERILGTNKVPLPGERLPVLGVQRTLEADPQARERAFSLPEPQLNDSWVVAGGTPDHAPGHLALPGPLREAWRASIGSGSAYRQRLTAPPLVAGETVFAMDAFGWVTALDVQRGNRRWQTDTRPRQEREGALGGAMAFHEGTLYVATSLSEIMALDPGTGEIRWRAPMPSPARGGLAVAGDRLMVPNIDNHLVGFATEDGRRVWTFRATPVQALMVGQPSPAVQGDIAVAAFASGEVVGVRPTDGRLLWNESLGGLRGAASLADIPAVTALPVVDRGRVFAMGLGGAATSLDLRSGRRVWERDIGGMVTPAVVGDWVFMLSREDELFCLGRDDARIRWITQLPTFENEARRTGPITWGPPVVAGGRVLVAGSHGQLLDIDPSSGEIGNRLRLPAGVTLQPAVAGGTAFLLSNGGSIVALRGTG
ncbi:MAG: PQQ-binding-like beta-propeller repeat protein [Rubritepida sp.]|jgi:outer membrane protein assembly factor BamB|nr:PQQ-binding-like beta-propeller repeat protein [Rubritepida sp.]